MALTPFRVVTLLASTLVFSIMGIVLVVAGVHGPEVAAWVGAFLLLPNMILMRLGVPIAIPFLHSVSILSVLVFLVLQAGYYYILFRITHFVAGRFRPRIPA
jgi:hypothetical protein